MTGMIAQDGASLLLAADRVPMLVDWKKKRAELETFLATRAVSWAGQRPAPCCLRP